MKKKTEEHPLEENKEKEKLKNLRTVASCNCQITVLSRLPKGISIFINRADVSFSSEESLAWHESDEEHPHYLFKLRKTAREFRIV